MPPAEQLQESVLEGLSEARGRSSSASTTSAASPKQAPSEVSGPLLDGSTQSPQGPTAVPSSSQSINGSGGGPPAVGANGSAGGTHSEEVPAVGAVQRLDKTQGLDTDQVRGQLGCRKQGARDIPPCT